MMHRSFFAIAATGLAAVLMSSSSAQAGASTAIFNTSGVTTSLSGTVYTLANWNFKSGDATGWFTGRDSASFGNVTFDDSTGAITFGDSSFGTFQGSSVTTVNATGALTQYLVLGTWTAGAAPNEKPVSGDAFLTITITSNAGILAGQGILAIPEPNSMVLGLTSLAIGGLTYGLRRRRASK